ncbi:glycosyltransferase [Cohnella suwonensis]|uniref:Glycosyltransferase n=1 Tax=Cohnella suwonensis TaxID=696072 RepID=A0ABW0LYL3_9BACL
MKTPFFSIILPTRNRSFIVEKAILSVINQTFSDWELLIIDNDVSDETSQVVHHYINEKIKYFRTGNLAMHDNWEFGVNKVKGKFITLLEDKASFVPDALEVIYHTIHKENVPIVSWNYGVLNKKIVKNPEASSIVFSSEQVIQFLLSHNYNHTHRILPRFVNSCCESTIIEKSKHVGVNRVFSFASPDITSMSLQLGLYDKLAYIDKELVFFDSKTSNGGAFERKISSVQYNDFISLSAGGNKENLVPDRTPCKLLTNYGSIINDYLSIREKVKGRLDYYPLDIINYYTEILRNFAYLEYSGTNISEEREIVLESLKNENPFIQRVVFDSNNLFNRMGTNFMIRAFNSTIGALVRTGQKMAVWGAGELGLYLLRNSNYLSEYVDIVIDKDKDRHGLKIDGTGAVIYSPDILNSQQIDVVIIASLDYAVDIKKELTDSYHFQGAVISAIDI